MILGMVLRPPVQSALAGHGYLASLGWHVRPLEGLEQALDPDTLPLATPLVAEWQPEGEALLAKVCQHRPTVLLSRSPSPDQARQALGLGASALLDLGADPAWWAASLPLWMAQHAERRAARQRDAEQRQAIADARSISAAVGLIAERENISIDQAFALLRNGARSQRRRLELAAADEIAAHKRRVIHPSQPDS